MKPPPPTSTIYVKGFSEDTKEAALLKLFGQIGVIRKHKETGAYDMFMYKDEAGVIPGIFGCDLTACERENSHVLRFLCCRYAAVS